MFASRWFQVFVGVVVVVVLAVSVSVSSVPKTANEISFDAIALSQTEAEEILSAETSFRRYLISSLANVRDKINQTKRFHIDEIIQDLQLRDVNPLKSLRLDGVTHPQTPNTLLAETTHSLQGRRPGATLIEWNALVETIHVGEPPNVRITAEHLQKVQEVNEAFVCFVLRGIQQENFRLNNRLLGDVLYNFPFKHSSPELVVVLENVNRTLAGGPLNFSNFHPDGRATNPDEILLDVLQFISRTDDVLAFGVILSALSDKGNVVRANPPELWGLFDLILEDDYPPDVISAKNTLSSAVRYNQIDLSGMRGTVKGRPPMEKLLMLITQLSFLPVGSPFYRAVHALHPHVKLRWLANEGRFFRPRSAADVKFLLNSFLTVSEEMDSVSVVDEIERIFLDSGDVLGSFDFSRYSKPRLLVVDMVRGLLDNSAKLPLCSVIILRYFLSKNQHLSLCRDDVDSPIVPMNGLTAAFERIFPPQQLAPVVATTPPSVLTVSPQPTASRQSPKSVYITTSMLSLASDYSKSSITPSVDFGTSETSTASVDKSSLTETSTASGQTLLVDSTVEEQSDASTQGVADNTTSTEYSTEGLFVLNANSALPQKGSTGETTWQTEKKPPVNETQPIKLFYQH